MFWDKIIEDIKNYDYSLLFWTILELIFGLLVLYLATKLLSFLFKKVLLMKSKGGTNTLQRRKTLSYVINSFTRYLFFGISLIYILSMLKIDTTTLLAGVGALGIIFSFAFQDLLKDFIAGIFLLIENGYSADDLIEIDGIIGKVELITLKSTIIVPFTGERVLFSNSKIGTVINYSATEYATVVVKIPVSYNFDVESFSTKIEPVLNTIGKENDIKDLSFFCINSLGINGMELEFRGVVKPTMQFASRRIIFKEVLLFMRLNQFNPKEITLPLIEDNK